MEYIEIAEIDVENGALVQVPFIQLIGALFARDGTGLLRLMRFKNEKEIYFLKGVPVYARSNITTEALGNIMVKKGLLDRNDRNKAREIMEQDGIREGEALIRMGKLNQKDLYKYLALQMLEKIMSCLEWKSGRYEFESREISEDNIDLFDINPVQVIFDGIKRFIQGPELMPLIGQLGEKYVKLSMHHVEHENLLKAVIGEDISLEKLDGTININRAVTAITNDPIKSSRILLALMTAGLVVLGDEKDFEEQKLDPIPLKPADYYPPRMGEDIEKEAERKGEEKEELKPTELPAFERARLARQAELKKAKQTEAVYSVSADQIKKDVLKPEKEKPPEEVRDEKATKSSRKKNTPAPIPQAELDRMTEYRLKKDYYGLLGLGDDAILPHIREAHYNLSKKYDTTNREGSKAEIEQIQKIYEAINEAYETLKDHGKRKDYESKTAIEEQVSIKSERERFILAEKYFKRGLRYGDVEDWGEAERYFLWAMTMNQVRADFPAYLGWAQFKQYAKLGLSSSHDITDPINNIRLAISIDSHHAMAHYFLGYIMKQMGNREAALEHLEKACESDPDLKMAKAELTNLQRRK